MSARHSNFDGLRAEYHNAFERWAAAVIALEHIRRSTADRTAVEEAEALVKPAEEVYRETRDRLAANMLDDC